jgi:hypothetical protein
VEFDNPDKILKFDIMVDVYIIVYTNPQALVVERKNILGDANDLYVYVARDGQAVKSPVVLGKQYKTDNEIVGGVKAGDLLIVEGQMLLQAGRKIKIIE